MFPIMISNMLCDYLGTPLEFAEVGTRSQHSRSDYGEPKLVHLQMELISLFFQRLQ